MVVLKTHSQRRLNFGRKFLLLAGLLLSVLLSSMPGYVYANISDDTPQEEARATIYYNTMRSCVIQGMKPEFQGGPNGGNTRDWFDDYYTDAVMVYPGGKTTCWGAMSDAISTWGWSSRGDFLRAMGYSESGGTWRGNSDRGQRQAQFEWAVQGQYYIRNFPGNAELSGAARHVVFMEVFSKACMVQNLGPVASIANTQHREWVEDASSSRGTEVPYDEAGISSAVEGSFVYFSKIDKVVETNDATNPYRKESVGVAYINNDDYIERNWNENNYSTASNTTGQVVVYGRTAEASSAENVVIRTCDEIQKGITDNANAYLQWLRENPDKAPGAFSASNDTLNSNPAQSAENTTSCAVEGVGWIVCPVAQFIGMLNDSMYNILVGFMKLSPSMFDPANSTRNVWQMSLNIANIAFVIAFLVIIMSQLTSIGVSNYGIKRMLPRLIVAAILVNVSFIICAVAVDLSNIVGSNIHNILNNAMNNSVVVGSGNQLGTWSDVTAFVLSGAATAAGVATVAVSVGTYGWLGALSLLIPGAIAALLAFAMVIVVLIARQALVILLVVLSPLAFVAYLLPNTEDWFKRWRKLFVSLLLMYPVIALLFGASALAGAIIRGTTGDALLYIGSLIITAVPLFALPLVMRATGGVLNRIGGFVNNPNRGIFDRAKKGAEQFRTDREGQRKNVAFNGGSFFGAKRFRRISDRKGESEGIQEVANKAEQRYRASKMTTPDENGELVPTKYAERVAGATGGRYGVAAQPNQADLQQVIANAQLAVKEAEIKEAKAARVVYEGRGMEANRAMSELTTGTNLTAAQKTALRSMAVEGGDAGHIEQLWNDSHNWSQSERNAFAGDLAKNKPAGIGMGAVAAMRGGKDDEGNRSAKEFRQLLAESAATGRFSTQATAGADKSELAMVREVLADAAFMKTQGYDDSRIAAIRNEVAAAAKNAYKDPRFGAGNNREAISELMKPYDAT